MIMWEMKMTRALHGSCPGRGSRPTLLSCREGLCHQPRLLVGVSSAPAARLLGGCRLWVPPVPPLGRGLHLICSCLSISSLQPTALACQGPQLRFWVWATV